MQHYAVRLAVRLPYALRLLTWVVHLYRAGRAYIACCIP